MKQFFKLPLLLLAFVFFAFAGEPSFELVNKTNAPLNEQLFNRLLMQKLKVKDLPVNVTVLHFASTSGADHLRNGNPNNEKQTTRVEYQCDLLVKVGDRNQRITKAENWQAPMGAIALTPPSTEQLIVDMIARHYKTQ